MSHAALATAPTPPPPPTAISPEQLQVLGEARRSAARITRAAGVATFSGWTTACFAMIALLGGLFGLSSLLLGIGLGTVAVVELRSSKALRRFDLAAPRRLALNQAGLFVVLTLYSAWGIGTALLGPGPYDDHLAAGGQIAETLEPIDRLTRAIMVGIYAAIICGSAVLQGCAAWYYASRRRHVESYLRETPEWVVRTLRATA